MCHYITGLLSPGADAAAVRRFAQPQMLDWESLAEHALEPPLRPGETYYSATRKGSCDCGTSIGMLAKEEGLVAPDHEHDRKRLKRKGWSDQKIDRWIDDRESGSRKAFQRNSHALKNPPGDIARWLKFISSVLDAKAANYLGLLVQWYDDLIELERINVERRWTPLKKLDHQYLVRADHDVIHIFCVDDYRGR